MDRNGLWVGLIVQVFLLGWAAKWIYDGISAEENLKIVLGSIGVGVLGYLIVVSVKKLRELY